MKIFTQLNQFNFAKGLEKFIMKLIILFALIATAIAVPLDEKRPLAAQQSSLNSNKPPLTSDSKAQAPLASSIPAKSPLHKRETPKANDQKTNAAPVTNTKKNAAVPNQSSGVVKPTNNRQTRDTQKAQNSYQPQASGVSQKTNVPAPTNVDSKTNTQNNRPARDAPKAQVTDQKSSLSNGPTVVTPQKNTAPLTSTHAKPQQNSRNRRDTVKQTDIKPVTWNKDDKTKTNAPPAVQQPSALNANRKTRETPKTSTNDKTKSPSPAPQPTDVNRKTRETPKSGDKAKAPVPAPQTNDNKRKTRETPKNTPTTNDKSKSSIPTHPEVAKVPLTSTNSRTRRDAPNPAEQSKLVPSGSISGKVDNPSTLARKDQATQYRRPVPVDQVIKQKNTDDKSAPADNAKPADNPSKKV